MLAKWVLKALAHTSGLDSTTLFVKATGRDVALTGAVPDASQIPRAVDSAGRVAGSMQCIATSVCENPD